MVSMRMRSDAVGLFSSMSRKQKCGLPAHSVICVTQGLVAKMDREELQGVLGHEMAHIRDYDIRTMMMVAVLVGVVESVMARLRLTRVPQLIVGAGALALFGIILLLR